MAETQSDDPVAEAGSSFLLGEFGAFWGTYYAAGALVLEAEQRARLMPGISRVAKEDVG